MWLYKADVHTRFIFDLEFVGDIAKDGPRGCRIWEIGCVCVDTGQAFRMALRPPVDNDILAKVAPGIKPISHAYLNKLQAVNQYDGFTQWTTWIRECCERTKKMSALLISHNCFKSDMPVIACEFGRYNMSFHQPTLFFDSLLFMRHVLRGKQVSDYSLQGIARALNIQRGQQHRALDDAYCLLVILQCSPMPLSGPCASYGFLPTLMLDGIGVSTNAFLETECDIFCVRQLVDGVVASQGSTDQTACRTFLSSLPVSKWPNIEQTALSLSVVATRMAW